MKRTDLRRQKDSNLEGSKRNRKVWNEYGVMDDLYIAYKSAWCRLALERHD